VPILRPLLGGSCCAWQAGTAMDRPHAISNKGELSQNTGLIASSP
jgi:hypothetical protein